MTDDEESPVPAIVAALRAGGIPPGVETAEALLCIAASFYALELHDAADFLKDCRNAYDAALKNAENVDPQRRMQILVARTLRETPLPGTDEAKVAGCSCPTAEEMKERLPKPPEHYKQFAMDPMCTVHSDLAMKLARIAGISGSA